MPSEAFLPPKRGVGLVYSPLLHSLFLDRADLIDVAEIEPQTAWTAADPIEGPFAQIEAVDLLWNELPQHKLLHSVAMPLAGTRRPSSGQMQLLASLADRFGCAYVSEHLSVGGTPHQNAGFLLPPRQTLSGVRQAARNTRELARGLGRPVAVETGVSYLPAFENEIDDGAFVRMVAEEADCGVLFDIHNAYCNERNGRQRLSDFVAALPAERIWEMHIAGGLEQDGYWLDAHSGLPNDELVAAAREIVRGLPSLAAIVFEVYPSYLRDGDDTLLTRSIVLLRELWEAAGKSTGDGDLRKIALSDRGSPADNGQPDPSQWEAGLTEAIRLDVPVGFGDDLSLRPAVELYSDLAHSFRASSLARLMPRTLRLLALRGCELEGLVRAYEAASPPPLFALNEAEAFAEWVMAQQNEPMLGSLCDYELALLSVPLTGTARLVRFEGDPQPLFQAIADGTPPPARLSGRPWEIEITPNQESNLLRSAMAS